MRPVDNEILMVAGPLYGCVEFGQMTDGKRDGSEHACDLEQLIVMLCRVRDHMKARGPVAYGWKEPK